MANLFAVGLVPTVSWVSAMSMVLSSPILYQKWYQLAFLMEYHRYPMSWLLVIGVNGFKFGVKQDLHIT